MGKVGSPRGRELSIINFSKIAFCSMLVHFFRHIVAIMFSRPLGYILPFIAVFLSALYVFRPLQQNEFSAKRCSFVKFRQIMPNFGACIRLVLALKVLHFRFNRMNFTDFMPLLEKMGKNVCTCQSVCIFFARLTPNRKRYEVWIEQESSHDKVQIYRE